MTIDYIIRRSNNNHNKRSEDDQLSKRKYRDLELRANKAIKDGKIFKVVGGWNVPRIKFELAKRGYVEVIDNVFKNMYTKLPDEFLLEKAENYNEYEQALLSKIIGSRRPKFIWTEQPHFYEPYSLVPLMNKILVNDMTFWLKDGLLRAVNKINGRAKRLADRINYPRSYELSTKAQMTAFETDFKLTYATNLIRFLNTRENILDYLTTRKGSVSQSVLDYCVRLILDHIQQDREFKVDENEGNTQNVAQRITWRTYFNIQRQLTEKELKKAEAEKRSAAENKRIKEYKRRIEREAFEKLLKAYDLIVNQGAKVLIEEENITLEGYIETIMVVDELVTQYWPWRRNDGYKNVWLVKPTSSGEGQGIKLFDSVESIKDHIDSKNDKFIVQKYIERPLLIYNTKFDLRQYFMVTIDDEYWRAWSHPICSVKLASEEFSLDSFNECIHLTNASIQQKYFYKKSNPNLPHHHMWNLGTFILYLENTMGQGYMWEEYIYPEIKRVLRKLSNSIAFHSVMKPGRFELFGCDWMIDENFTPYLLEINRPPCLGIYSPVSTTVCGTICEDIVRGKFNS